MYLGGSAYQSHRHRNLYGTDQVSIFILFPSGQRCISSVSGRIRMGSRFYGSGIVSGGDDYWDYSVHRSLVMGCGPVRIGSGKSVCVQHLVYYFSSADVLFLPRSSHSDQSSVCQIGKYSQLHASLCDLFDVRSHGLRHGVHRIGSHGVESIYQQVDDYHRACHGVYHSNFHIFYAAAEIYQYRILLVAYSDYLIFSL